MHFKKITINYNKLNKIYFKNLIKLKQNLKKLK